MELLLPALTVRQYILEGRTGNDQENLAWVTAQISAAMDRREFSLPKVALTSPTILALEAKGYRLVFNPGSDPRTFTISW